MRTMDLNFRQPSNPLKMKTVLLPTQRQALDSIGHFDKVAYFGGYGAGKTFWLLHQMLRLGTLNPGVPAGLMCPTLKMAKRDVIPSLMDIAHANKFFFRYNRSDFYVYLPQTRTKVWIFHSEDDGQSVKGPNLGFFLFNEVTLCTENAYLAGVARVRHPNAPVKQIAMSGTFEEFGGVFDLVSNDDTCLKLFASTRENSHLGPGYVKMLEQTYDAELQQQYIDGIPVRRLGKAACRKFKRNLHISETAERIPGAPIWISLDFNVDPMSAVIWNRVIQDNGIKLIAFDEIKLNASDTPDIARFIESKYGHDVTIYPDPAGNSRSSKGIQITDISILKEKGFKQIKFKRRIVSVKDCMTAVDLMFERNEIIINPRCKEFIKDLEQVKWRDSGFEFDKTDQKRTHWLDGFKDMIDYEFPVIKPSRSSQSSY